MQAGANSMLHLTVRLALLFATARGLAVCPGEIRDDYKCDHDTTHRVCAQLLDSSGSPISYGTHGTFWYGFCRRPCHFALTRHTLTPLCPVVPPPGTSPTNHLGPQR